VALDDQLVESAGFSGFQPVQRRVVDDTRLLQQAEHVVVMHGEQRRASVRTKAALVLSGGPAYRQCVGLVDAQIDELVRVVDQLLAGLTGADESGVGAVGVPGAQVGPDHADFTGRAGSSWRAAREELAAGDARIASGDEALTAALSSVRAGSAQIRSRLTAMRAELLDLMQSGNALAGLAETAQAKAQELRGICDDAQRVSGAAGRSVAAASAMYGGRAAS
jgi:hypothetical protein